MQKKYYIQPLCSLVVIDESDELLNVSGASSEGRSEEVDSDLPSSKKTTHFFSNDEIFFNDSAGDEDDEASVLDDIISW